MISGILLSLSVVVVVFMQCFCCEFVSVATYISTNNIYVMYRKVSAEYGG